MSKIVVTVEEVTPEIAREWLDTMKGNRPLDDSKVNLYVNDMINGRWHLGNDLIIFDTKGILRNGQHRLKAVVISGMTIQFMIRRNVEIEEVSGMDQGRVRDIHSAAIMMGKKMEKIEPKIARAILAGKAISVKLSTKMGFDAIDDLKEPIRFVWNECFMGKHKASITTAPVLGVFGRAYLAGEDKEKLRYAGRYLMEANAFLQNEHMGRMVGTNSLDSLIRYLYESSSGDHSARSCIYWKVEQSLRNFLDGKDVTRLLAAKEELFELPPRFSKKSYMQRNVNNISSDLVSSLQTVASNIQDGDILGSKELSSFILDSGFKVCSSNPIKAVQERLRQAVDRSGGKISVTSGIFEPLYSVENSKRIHKFSFTAAA
jgi:hypothetical protein